MLFTLFFFSPSYAKALFLYASTKCSQAPVSRGGTPHGTNTQSATSSEVATTSASPRRCPTTTSATTATTAATAQGTATRVTTRIRPSDVTLLASNVCVGVVARTTTTTAYSTMARRRTTRSTSSARQNSRSGRWRGSRPSAVNHATSRCRNSRRRRTC